MSEFIKGFFNALAQPNSAQHLYDAGTALSNWLGEQKKSAAAHEQFQSQNIDYSAPVKQAVRKPDPNLQGLDKLKNTYVAQPMANQPKDSNDAYQYYTREQLESEKMLNHLHDGIMKFLNEGDPRPASAIGNNPIVPRGHHVQDPLYNPRRR